MNWWISQVSQPLCGSLLGKQAASTQCHPQFGSSSHMTPPGWPCYSLSGCLLTSHSSCQQVIKLKCQHRHLSLNPTSLNTHTHTHTALSPLVAPGEPVGSSTVNQWLTKAGAAGARLFCASNISHFHTHFSPAISLSNCIIAALLQCAEVHGREGSIKI